MPARQGSSRPRFRPARASERQVGDAHCKGGNTPGRRGGVRKLASQSLIPGPCRRARKVAVPDIPRRAREAGVPDIPTDIPGSGRNAKGSGLMPVQEDPVPYDRVRHPALLVESRTGYSKRRLQSLGGTGTMSGVFFNTESGSKKATLRKRNFSVSTGIPAAIAGRNNV